MGASHRRVQPRIGELAVRAAIPTRSTSRPPHGPCSGARRHDLIFKGVNALAESFNGRFRDECLNEHLFRSLAAARWIIEAWRIDYNHNRPHSSLNGLTPAAFATRRQQRHRENRILLMNEGT